MAEEFNSPNCLSIPLLAVIKYYHHIINFRDKQEKYLHIIYHLIPSQISLFMFRRNMNKYKTNGPQSKLYHTENTSHLHLKQKTEVI